MRKKGKRRRGRELKKKKGDAVGLVGSSSKRKGMSRITAGINERGVCCSTIYSLLIEYTRVCQG